MDQMCSRFTTAVLILATSLKIHAAIGVLFLPMLGALQYGEEQTACKVALRRTNATSLRSELVIQLSNLVKLTRSSYISWGHSNLQTKCSPSSFGFSHTPLPPNSEVSVYPWYVGCHCIISVK